MTDKQTPRRYGSAFRGSAEDPARCIEGIWHDFSRGTVQCRHARGKGPGGLYCGIHDPDARAEKQRKRDALREAERKLRMEAHPLTIARRENEKLRAALEPFARFAEMFEQARALGVGQIPTEHDAEWYQRDTQGGTFVLRVGMFYDAKKALQK
jgi:hypothetical protein